MKKIRLIIIGAFLVRLFLIFGPYHPDLGNHLDWGNRFWQYGPKNFYTANVWSVSWPNQPPGTMYLWAGLSQINRFVQNFAWYFNLKYPIFPSKLIPWLNNHFYSGLVKLPSVLAELGIGFLLYFLALRFGFSVKKALIASALFLFNPAIIYNSAVWGQTDGLINFFALLAIFLILEDKFFWGILFFGLSLYFKMSLLIFAPLFLILLLSRKIVIWKIPLYFSAVLLVFVILSLPFSTGNPFLWFFTLYKDKVLGSQGNMLTGNAFNLWAFIFGIDLSRSDKGFWLNISFRYWGYLAFGVAYLAVLIKNFKTKLEQGFLLSFSLIAFASFLFMTNMHERYLYPVFPFLALLSVVSERFLFFYLVLSVIHGLNLYYLWYYPRLNFLQAFLDSHQGLVPKILSGVLIFIFGLLLFYPFNRQKVQKNAKIAISR